MTETPPVSLRDLNRREWGQLLLTLFCVAVAIALLRQWRQTANRYPPGHRGFLAAEAYGVTLDEGVQTELRHARAVGDQYAIDDLVAKNKASVLERGTEILVVDKGRLLAPRSRVVRVLSGQFEGTKWFVEDLSLAPGVKRTGVPPASPEADQEVPPTAEQLEKSRAAIKDLLDRTH